MEQGRRDFLGKAMAVLATVDFASPSASAEPAPAVVRLERPVKPALLSKKELDGNILLSLELLGANGASKRIDAFYSGIENEAEYERVMQIMARHFNPGETEAASVDCRAIVVMGKKGPTEGDIRRDTIDMYITHLGSGVVHHVGPQQGSVALRNQFAGLSDEELVEKFLTDKFR